jgi:hypothetical protein
MEEEINTTEIKSNVERLELYSDNYPFNLSLRIKIFESETDYNKFIKNCEKLIRGSQEYKLWRNYIIDVLQIQSCAITLERMDQTSIDIHHHPVSLFTLVKSLVNERLEKEEEFCTFDICTKAIELHFQNIVGFVALLSSMHEKFHNGFLNIPRSMIKGNYNVFLAEYSKYLDEEELDVISSRLSITDHNCNWSADDYPGAKEGVS